MLKDCQYETDVFLDRAELLGEKLGCLLLQFPPNFSVDYLPDLTSFLCKLPKQNHYVVEVRNRMWLKQEFYSLLKANNIALAWADSPLMAQNEEVTADFLYIRWEGNRKKVNGTLGKKEVDKQGYLNWWADKIKFFLDKGTTVFGYFGKYYSGYPPSDITYLQTILNSN